MYSFVEILMDYYYLVAVIVGIVLGLLIAICSKKKEGVTYSKLDKSGRIVNIVLIVVYALLLPFFMFIGAICRPAYEGVLGVLGIIVSLVVSSVSLYCALGLGASVALRKKGKSKLSFAMQFAGFAGMVVALALFFIFYGNLLAPIN